jgi:hypothetical protein
MLAEIEEAIVELTREKWPDQGGTTVVNEFDIELDFERVLNTPGLAVAIETVALRRNPDGSIHFIPTISVYLVFKNVGQPAQRRRGIHPMIVGTVCILSGSDLGLDIDPLLPISAGELLHEQLKAKGLIGFRLQFTSGFDVEKVDGEDAVRLMSESISYYKESETTAPKASGTINYPEQIWNV